MTTPNFLPRFLSATVASLPLAFVAPAITLAESVPVFDLSNNTSVTLTELYISPTFADNWEEDILDTTTLPAGSSIEVTIDDGRDTCMYDVLGVFADGDKVEDYEVDICELVNTGYQFYEN